MFKSATAKGEETRRRIYEAALALFRDRGFESATMREIAAAAGMSLGAAYHYFDSKDAIVLAYYDIVASEHDRRVREQLRDLKSPRDRLRVPFHTVIDIVQGDRGLMGALLRYTGQPNHPLSFLGAATRQMRLRNMALFAEALRGTNLPEDSRVLAPLALWAMHMGMMLFFLYDDSPGQRRTRRLVDSSVDLFLAGLKLAKLPVFRGLRRKILDILGDAGLVPDAGELAAVDVSRIEGELALA